MKRLLRRMFGPLLALGLLGPGSFAAAGALPPAKTPPASSPDSILPGPRTCFWNQGPVSGSPYINVAYPDSGVFYWTARFSAPAGSRLSLGGRFAHARYQSLISYDQAGRPVEALADYLIRPDAGSANPYRTGADRTAARRDYRVEVAAAAPDPNRKEGVLREGDAANVVHAPPSPGGVQTLIYRIYAGDRGLDPTAGAGLPGPVLTLADGTVLRGQDACRVLAPKANDVQGDAAGLPLTEYRKLLNQPGKPDTWPATAPPTWHIQLDRASLLGIYTGQISPNARRSEGGFYPNPDNNYVRTIVNRRLGPVLLLRGRIPITPHTWGGDKVMTAGQLRYWSICSNKGFANTMVNGCLFDEQVPVDRNGVYTIVVSRDADRPRNARPECGLAWLPMADDGDGAIDKDVSVIQIRNMLAAPDFANAVQRAQTDGEIKSAMGPYLPTATYLMPNQVEIAFGCRGAH